jgi:hypothetical protein
MTEDTRDTRALLEEAIRRRDELNTFIKVYQEILGRADESSPVPTPNGGGAERPASTTRSGFDPLGVVYPGMFFGKTQPQAVKMLLEKVKPRPMKTRTVIEELSKGGLVVGGKKPAVNLWSILNRNPETFILVPKAGWGLVEWYEPSVIAKMRAGKAAENEGEEEEVAKSS